MSVRNSRIGVIVILAGSMTGGGCGLGSSASRSAVSTTEATVNGKVTANGIPVSKGKVTVSPPGPPFVENVAEIQKDGSYQIKTFVGKNSFSVTGTGNSAAGGSYNKTIRDVNEGSNTIDLALPLGQK